MLAWRIAKKEFALDRIGTGARMHGGRWNSPGRPAIYAGLTPELAALETLVHTGETLPQDLVIVLIELPDDEALYETPASASLPDSWNELPSSVAAAAYGDTFLAKSEWLGLIIPSTVIPESRNIIINPNHPGMVDVKFSILREFRFDSRLRL